MSATATIAITVGVAVAVLVGFFIIYYLGNIANSIYDVKVGVRKDFDKKIKELQEWVEKDTKQRVKWMRDENKEEGKRFKEGMEGHFEETFTEMEKTIERLRADVASLQNQVNDLQAGKATGARQVNEGPALKRPTMSPQQAALGELEVPKTGIPESDVAPDLAAPKPQAIQSKPSPPPAPASAQQMRPQPAGRASVEQKARQKRRTRRPPDEFESFDQFSEDFKAGN